MTAISRLGVFSFWVRFAFVIEELTHTVCPVLYGWLLQTLSTKGLLEFTRLGWTFRLEAGLTSILVVVAVVEDESFFLLLEADKLLFQPHKSVQLFSKPQQPLVIHHQSIQRRAADFHSQSAE